MSKAKRLKFLSLKFKTVRVLTIALGILSLFFVTVVYAGFYISSDTNNGLCSTSSGLCGTPQTNSGPYIYKFYCDGNVGGGNTCEDNAMWLVNGNINARGQYTVNDSDGTGINNPGVTGCPCGKTCQLDAFDGGTYPNGCRERDWDPNSGWVCGPATDYLLWYDGDCPPPPPVQVSVSGRVYCQDNNQGVSGVQIFLNDLNANQGGGDTTVTTNANGNFSGNNLWITAGDRRYDVELNNNIPGWQGPFISNCPAHCQRCQPSGSGGREYDECTASDSNLNFYFTNCVPATPTPIPNNPPTCQSLNTSSTVFSPGDVITITGVSGDSDGTPTNVALYWIPASTDYCSNNWTQITNTITPNAGGSWSYNWNTTGFTYDGQIMIAANVRDDDNALCTGNPGATVGNNSCGTGLAVCKNPNTPGGCNRLLTAVQNQAPTASASITSNETCSINGNTLSGQISGQYNDTNNTALNNPLTVVSTHTDTNGVADIDLMGIWITESANGHPTQPNENALAAFARVRRTGANTYEKLAYGNGAVSTTDTRVVATMSGSNTQQFRSTGSLGSAIAYANPTNISQNGNTITITWQVALISPAVFDGNLVVYSFTQDQAGTTPTAGSPIWVQSAQSWIADLQPPTISPSLNNFPVNPQFLPGNQVQVTWGATDNRQLFTNGYSKRCGADNLLPGENITLNGTLIHSVNNNLVTCFNNTVSPPPRTDTYTVQDNSTAGNLLFSLGAADMACNTVNTVPVSVSIPDPWLMTTRGDAFSNEFNVTIPNAVQNTNLAIEDGLPAHLSTYLYLQKETGPLPPRASKNNFERALYSDQNTLPRVPGAGNWYVYLRDKVLEGGDVIETRSGLGVGGAISGTFGVSPSSQDIHVMHVTGNANLGNLLCNIKTVFLIDGDLSLFPEIDTPAADDGCVFIVQGKTTITAGFNKGSNDTTPITNYDEIHAFIITNSFETQTDPGGDGLLIEGGVITTIVNTNAPTSFNRNLGLLRNQDAPAEIFRYDGTRYMYLFGDLFTYEKNYNIREKQFIQSLNN